ncbi:50S ribosomal protein L24 [Candidatus Kaiserbacteria bacterium]|nr:50S ribosomal protein L24 [Candidatus Kaiserbacteria bacterium]
MKIRKGDNVIVIAGKDRGKTGTVIAAFPKREQVLVEGIGMVKKHQKSRRRGQAGQIVDRPSPIHVSNVAAKDPKTGKVARVGYRVDDGKKVRVAKPSNDKI